METNQSQVREDVWSAGKDGTPDYAPQYTVYSHENHERVATVFSEVAARAIEYLPDLMRAARSVIDNWDSGDLADSVRGLDDILYRMEVS